MSNYTFLVGNGINRAVDQTYFTLEKGMEEAWKKLDSNLLKSVVYESLGKKGIPKTEEQLEKIQEYIFTITSIQNDIQTLPDVIKKQLNFSSAKKFKENYFSYLFDISRHFYDFPEKLGENDKFKEFVENFSTFIKKAPTKGCIHVATLNYDQGLYGEFLSNEILCREYSKTHLSDGFESGGFDSENLEEKFNEKYGWFLHLHGSPLFYNNEDIILKSERCDSLESDKDKRRNHIILCNTKQKYRLYPS